SRSINYVYEVLSYSTSKALQDQLFIKAANICDFEVAMPTEPRP
ncbi:3752_t:CDS:1, partial [Cetraspora pellucida]